jgi:type VI secretion system secreted protein VgrG
MAVVRNLGASADITFRVGTLDETTLEVVQFEGRETVSRLFHFSLDLVSRDAWIDFDEVIGQPALVTIQGDPAPRHVSAIVCRFEQAGRGTDFTRYRAELVPAVWLLTQRKNCCIFQNLSVPDIIRQVFERASVPSDAYRFALRGDYAPRDYCVQYRESDMEFAARLLEEEGIFFFFEHSAAGHVLVMADHTDAHPAIVEPETVRLAETGYGVTSEEFLSSFRFTREIRTGAVATRDYDFTRSSLTLAAEAEAAVHPELEAYDYPGGFQEIERGAGLAKVRLAEEQAATEVAFGRSDCRRLVCGYTFLFDGHERSSFNGRYLITAATHRGSQPQVLVQESGGAAAPDAEGPLYENELECIPAGRPFRPPRVTPRPIIAGSQTATVVGPAGEKAWPDEYGRVKVQFHWDRLGQRDERSSCWVRVSQNWAGQGWGGMFLPHIGQEVIVDFLEGDPDRPIITGRVYNADNMPYLALPENKLKSVIRDDYGNQMIFDATPGDEHIHLFSPHHSSGLMLGKSVKNYTWSDWDNYTVGATMDTRYGDSVGIQYGSKHLLMFGLTTSTFGGFAGNLWVGGSFGITIGVKMDLSVAGSFSVGVGGKYSFFMGPEITAGSNNFTKSVNKNITLDANKTVKIVGGSNNQTIFEGDSKALSLRYETDGPESDVDRHIVNTMKALGLTAVGLGVAAAGTAVLVGHTNDAARDKQSQDPNHASANYLADSDQLKGWGYGVGGTILAGTAAGGVAYGIYKLWRKKKDKEKKAKEKMAIRHGSITLDEDGVMLRGQGGAQGANKVTAVFLASEKMGNKLIKLTTREGPVQVVAKTIVLKATEKLVLDAPEVIVEKNKIKSKDGNWSEGY